MDLTRDDLVEFHSALAVTDGQRVEKADIVTRCRFRRLSDGDEQPVTGLPESARINYLRWSPDGQRIAFMVESKGSLSLWSAELSKLYTETENPEGDEKDSK